MSLTSRRSNPRNYSTAQLVETSPQLAVSRFIHRFRKVRILYDRRVKGVGRVLWRDGWLGVVLALGAAGLQLCSLFIIPDLNRRVSLYKVR